MGHNQENIINIAILASGNGSNMENLVLSLHNKTLSQSLRQNGMNLARNIQAQQRQNGYIKEGNTLVINNSTIQDSMLLKDPRIQVIKIISDREDAHVLKRAKRLGLSSHVIASTNESKKEFDMKLLSYLQDLQKEQGLDCILLAGFMRILGKDFLKGMSNVRILNIHPSLLPLHKGLNAIKASFNDDNSFGGVSVHFVTEELDSGMIILQEKIEKIANESMEDFEQRIHDLEYRIYPQAFLKALAQGIHNV